MKTIGTPGMTLFRIALGAAWLVMLAITVYAVDAQGTAGLGTFISDFRNPWRAQVNADFTVHLGLAMAWILYRERTVTRGLIFALPVLLGSTYLLPYVFVASFSCGGRLDALVFGRRDQNP